MSSPIDLGAISTGLREVEPGLWESTTTHRVSYPESRHGGCFAVEDSSFWFGHRNRCVASVVERFPPAGTVFDIGGGNGFVTIGLQDAGFDAVLVEPGKFGVQNAQARGLAPVVCSTFEDARFLPQSLPAAGLFDVLEHIENDGFFLREIRRCLEPGGRLYLSVPAHRFLWSHEDKAVGHWRRYSRSSLIKVLVGTGFKPEYITHLFWFLPVPILLFRVLPSLLHPQRPLSRVVEQDHRVPDGLGDRLLTALLDREVAIVAKGRRVPVGSSLVAVARRVG